MKSILIAATVLPLLARSAPFPPHAVVFVTDWVTDWHTVTVYGGSPTKTWHSSVAPTLVASKSSEAPAVSPGASSASASNAAPALATTPAASSAAAAPAVTPASTATAPTAATSSASAVQGLSELADTSDSSSSLATSGSTSASCEGSGNACQGDVTYWEGGLGACGTTVDTNNDMAIALPFAFMGTLSNTNPYCGRSVTLYNPTSGTTVSATVRDKCMGCVDRAIDCTQKLFNAITDGKGDGRVHGITWWFD